MAAATSAPHADPLEEPPVAAGVAAAGEDGARPHPRRRYRHDRRRRRRSTCRNVVAREASQGRMDELAGGVSNIGSNAAGLALAVVAVLVAACGASVTLEAPSSI